MVALRIDTWEDIDALTDVQYLLTKPLCLVCDDAELLEAALRVYQGARCTRACSRRRRCCP